MTFASARPQSNNDDVPISKLGHGRISQRSVHSIFPSPENDKLYRPVNLEDPEIISLAQSIRERGILEPLVISRDGFILSGHRRHAASKLAGLSAVPCRIVPIYRRDPQFLVLLREANRQRVKSLDETLREEVVSADPEGAYANLVQYRQAVARVTVETGTIEGYKHRAAITKAKAPLLNAIKVILSRLQEFWPLSDRLIHYQLLNDPPLIHASKPTSTYRNDLNSYKALTDVLTRARIAGLIPFKAIHDPTRPVQTWDTFRSPGAFVRRELDRFLKYYWRDLQASQPCHLEILGEKNTVASTIEPVAMDYTIPYTLGRGYSSLPPRYDMMQRFRDSGKERLILLVLSDFDPEGQDIAHSFARSMRDDFGIDNITFLKVALTGDQVEELDLPPGATAKKGSSRRKKFVSEHGEHVFELEAVEPGRLQLILREVIESVLDMDLFRAEQEKERQDAAFLEAVRRKAIQNIGDLPDTFDTTEEE
jgi:hypothetical protein